MLSKLPVEPSNKYRSTMRTTSPIALTTLYINTAWTQGMIWDLRIDLLRFESCVAFSQRQKCNYMKLVSMF